MKKFLLFLVFLVLLAAAYFWVVLNWSYSSGERAGYVQKISHKGWLCKTWEGELALVSLPGSMTEKFFFTVHDDKVAESIQQAVGKRVALHYEEKVGLPTTCFGDTRYFVRRVTVTSDGPPALGVVPAAPVVVPAPAPAAPALPASK